MLRLSPAKLLSLMALTFFLTLYIIPHFAVGGIKPDVWVLLIIFFAFRVDWKKTPWLAIAVGFLKDLLSTRIFGIELFSLGLSSLLLSYLIGKLEREDPVVMIALTALFSIVYETLAGASFIFLSGSYDFIEPFSGRIFWITLYTLVLVPGATAAFEFLSEGIPSRPRR